MEYQIIKTLHILSSVLMVGTGFGSAFYLFFANRSGSVATIANVSRLVVRADWWFTTPSIIFQPLSGAYLIWLVGYPVSSTWIVWTMALYALAGVCWLPVVWMQIRMAKMAEVANLQNEALPEQYWKYAKLWERLGYPAFAAMLVVYFLMVMKPA